MGRVIPGILRTPLTAVATGVAALLLLAACDSGVTTAAPAVTAADPGMPGMSAPAPSDTAPASVAPVSTDTIAIQNFAFTPAAVTVKAGTTITWTNQDQDPHTVTAMGSDAFQSPVLSTGQTFRYRFTTPGTYAYLCTIHPFMTATVVVTP